VTMTLRGKGQRGKGEAQRKGGLGGDCTAEQDHSPSTGVEKIVEPRAGDLGLKGAKRGGGLGKTLGWTINALDSDWGV